MSMSMLVPPLSVSVAVSILHRRSRAERVTHPGIVLTLLATEPSRSERARAPIYVPRDTIRAPGIIAVGGQQLL